MGKEETGKIKSEEMTKEEILSVDILSERDMSEEALKDVAGGIIATETYEHAKRIFEHDPRVLAMKKRR